MAEPDPLDRPGAPGGTQPKAPLEFPRRSSEEPEARGATINIWRVTLYFVILVLALSALVYFIVRPR